MRRRATTLAERETRAVRLAWWVSFLATLTLVAILGLAHSAQAASVPIAGPLLSAVTLPTALDPDEEAETAEEDGDEVEECEGDEDENECAEEAEEETGDECILKSAEATVLVLPEQAKVRLTLRYTTFFPAVVNVRYGLRGGKGRLKMGGDSRRFGHRGVFRETEELSEAEMAKTKAATEFEVDAHAVNTPGYCRRLFGRKLTARHASGGTIAWTD
jgi:hypothetical protein